MTEALDLPPLLRSDPCQTCPIGIALFTGFDEVRRCRRCVHEFAIQQGWWPTPGELERLMAPREVEQRPATEVTASPSDSRSESDVAKRVAMDQQLGLHGLSEGDTDE